MQQTIEKMKEDMIEEIASESSLIKSFIERIPDPLFEPGARVKGNFDISDDPYRRKWIVKTGVVAGLGLFRTNFSVISHSRFDLRFGTTWKYEVHWDDGTTSRHHYEDSLKPTT